MTGRSGSPGDLGLDGLSAHRATNRLAIVALAIAIVSPVIGGIPALILGYKARSQIRAKNQAGKWLAIVAIVIGWLCLAFLISFAIGVVIGLNSHSSG